MKFSNRDLTVSDRTKGISFMQCKSPYQDHNFQYSKLQTCEYGQKEGKLLQKTKHLQKASSTDNINFQLTQTSIGDILPQLLQSQDEMDESVVIKETLSPRIDEIGRTKTLYSPPPVL